MLETSLMFLVQARSKGEASMLMRSIARLDKESFFHRRQTR